MQGISGKSGNNLYGNSTYIILSKKDIKITKIKTNTNGLTDFVQTS